MTTASLSTTQKDLISNLANMAKVVNGLEELEEIVKRHEQKDNPNS